MIFHGYYRSTSSWRMRVALAIKKPKTETISYHLRRCEQHLPGYRALNQQGLVSALQPDRATDLTNGVTVDWPWLTSIEKACLQIPAFLETRPKTQPDAES